MVCISFGALDVGGMGSILVLRRREGKSATQESQRKEKKIESNRKKKGRGEGMIFYLETCFFHSGKFGGLFVVVRCFIYESGFYRCLVGLLSSKEGHDPPFLGFSNERGIGGGDDGLLNSDL